MFLYCDRKSELGNLCSHDMYMLYTLKPWTALSVDGIQDFPFIIIQRFAFLTNWMHLAVTSMQRFSVPSMKSFFYLIQIVIWALKIQQREVFLLFVFIHIKRLFKAKLQKSSFVC